MRKRMRKVIIILLIITIVLPMFILNNESIVSAKTGKRHYIVPAKTAKDIKISNAEYDKNGRHVIAVGQSYDFDSILTPKYSKDKTYWFINNTKYAAVDTSKGIVTGIEPGIVELTAIACRAKSKAWESNVRDSIWIEIISIDSYDEFCDYYDYFDSWNHNSWKWEDWDQNYWDWDSWDQDYWDYDDFNDFYNDYIRYYPDKKEDPHNDNVFKVKEVALKEARKLLVTFDESINPETVIGPNNSLLNSVIITQKEDSHGVWADNLGNLTVYLSDNRKTLIIESGNGFNGLYGIHLKSAIKSMEGSVLIDYNKDFTFYNKKPLPPPVSVSQDQNNNSIIYIQFNNDLDKKSAESKTNYSISGLSIASAELINSTTIKLTLKPGTISSNQSYQIMISGLKGYQDSYSAMPNYQSMIYLRENTAPTLKNIYFTYPNTLTLTFDEAVTGYANFAVIYNGKDINSGTSVVGNTVLITLKHNPDLESKIYIIPAKDLSLKDYNGNIVSMIPSHVYISKY